MDRVRSQVGFAGNAMEGMRRDLISTDDRISGVTVGVLDSGVWAHPDLRDKVVLFRDFVNGKNRMYDDNGHGTHICGIICGSGAMSGGKYRGIAPQCRLVVGKVLDKKGEGLAQHMLDGLDWILENREKQQIRVLNISVGIGSMEDDQKEAALKAKIEEVWNSGIVVVCAAGNKGPANNSISAVGNSKKVITVGCHDGQYCRENPKRCETYSGRGEFAAIIRKPDLVAPGTDIWSCNVVSGRIRSPLQYYAPKSGTSMATPIVTGAVALLLQKFPDITNESVKLRLTYTAEDLGLPWNQQGWGMVNIKNLLEKY